MVFEFESIARREIIGLPVYNPGLGIEEVKQKYGVDRVIKLASNENPLGPSPLAVRALEGAVGEVSLYPDGACRELREKLSVKLGVAPERFVFGNGTDELFDLMTFSFLDPGDSIVMGDPTFSSYFLSGMTMGARMINVPLEDYCHHVDGMLEAVDETTKVVFVGSPHNPTGTICDGGDLLQMLEGLPRGVLLVWDEAYCEYVEDPSYPDSLVYLERYPNLVVFRTFSKIYGLAGLRVGYGMAHPAVVRLMEKVRLPFNVNRLAQIAASAAVDDDEHVERSRRVNSMGKTYLTSELERLGMEVVPSQANFLLVRYDGVTDDMAERLLARGVIVRDGAALGYPGCVRVTVGTPEQNQAVVEAAGSIIAADDGG